MLARQDNQFLYSTPRQLGYSGKGGRAVENKRTDQSAVSDAGEASASGVKAMRNTESHTGAAGTSSSEEHIDESGTPKSRNHRETEEAAGKCGIEHTDDDGVDEPESETSPV